MRGRRLPAAALLQAASAPGPRRAPPVRRQPPHTAPVVRRPPAPNRPPGLSAAAVTDVFGSASPAAAASSFAALGLPTLLVSRLAALGFSRPTLVQTATSARGVTVSLLDTPLTLISLILSSATPAL